MDEDKYFLYIEGYEGFEVYQTFEAIQLRLEDLSRSYDDPDCFSVIHGRELSVKQKFTL